MPDFFGVGVDDNQVVAGDLTANKWVQMDFKGSLADLDFNADDYVITHVRHLDARDAHPFFRPGAILQQV